MDAVTTEDLLSASLLAETGSGEGVDLSTVVDSIAESGQRLSQQVEVAVAVEKLVERGLVRRETADGTERLSLTEAGHASAERVADRLAGQRIELVDGDQRRELTVAEAAAELGRSPVSIAAECSGDGVYYRQQRVESDELVGRDEERRRFDAVLDRVEETGDGAVVRLVGPGGNGKTALVDALLAETPDTVDVGRTSSAAAGTEPYRPVRDVLDQFGGDDVLATSPVDVEDAESFEAQQTGLFSDITERLTPEGGVRVLVFDDVNHADAGTWQYLGSLCRESADRPLVVVLVHRPGTLPEDAPIHPTAAFDETCIEVTGLDRDGTRQLIEQVLGRRGVPAEFVQAVHERTSGAPLFVETTVETLRETGQVDPQLGLYPSDPADFELPDEVTETIQRQATFLEDDVRRVLEWVAVASGFVPASLVEQAADYAPERVGTILDTVTGMGLLNRETRAGETHVTVRNEVFGDALADRLSDPDRNRRHETIARLLEARTGDGDAEDRQPTADRAATVAYHHERSGNLADAIEWYEAAAARATDVYAHETAVEYYYRVVDLARRAGETETVLAANEGLAEVYVVTGDFDQADKHVQFVRERMDGADTGRAERLARLRARIHNARGEFDEATEVATAALDGSESVEQCRLLGVLAEAHHGQSDFERLRETAQRQRELARALDDRSLEADAVRRLGLAARRRSDFDRAREYYEESLAIAEETGNRKLKAKSLGGLGITAWNRGQFDRAHEYSVESLAIKREIGDRPGEAQTLNNLGTIAWMRGNTDRAREYFESCLDLSRDIGDINNVSIVRNNLGNIARIRGSYEQAREHYRESLALDREMGNRQGETSSLLNLGSIDQSSGRLESAREHYEESLELAREIGSRKDEGSALANLGSLTVRQGHYDRAREYFAESLEIVREVGDTQTETAVLNGLAGVARRCGDDERAREYYAEALETAEEQDLLSFAAMSLRGLCVVTREQGDLETAGDHFERALELSEDHGVHSEQVQVQLAGGELALARGDLALARERAESARETCEEIGIPYWRGRSRELLGTVEREDGDAAAAREHWEAAAETFETVGTPAAALRTLERLVETCLANGDDEAAREYHQRAARARDEAPPPVAEHHGGWVDRRSGTRGEPRADSS